MAMLSVMGLAMAAAVARAGGTVELLPVDGGQVSYEVVGPDGPTVVCVPGMGDTRAQWRGVVGPFVARGYRVVLMDMRGMGDSPPTFASYRPEDVGADVVALLKHLDVRDVVLMGNSFGAAAAVWAAAQAADRVGTVVLTGPFVRAVETSFAMRVLMDVMFAAPWGRQAWMAYYKTLYISTPPADHEAHLQHLAENLAVPGRMDVVRAMMRASKAAAAAQAPNVRAPVLVAMGSRDPDFRDPAEEARLVAEMLRGQVWMVDGVGHYPQAEQPHALVDETLRFVESKGQDHGRKSGVVSSAGDVGGSGTGG